MFQINAIRECGGRSKKMAGLNSIFNFLTSNILTRAELFVGLIILLGYILQRKKWYECVGGFFKGVIGYLILMVGANGLITTFRPILVGLNERFQLNAMRSDVIAHAAEQPMLSNASFEAFSPKYGSITTAFN